MTDIKDSQLVLQQVYAKEKSKPDAVYMTQPMGGGRIERYSWARTLDEARRIASFLKAQDFPPKSQIALISKNCAHFVMTDLAIWMAGHVSVALYPTLNEETVRYILEHSEAKMLFVGKLDTWDEMKGGVPEGMPMVSYPLSPPNDYPTWNDIIKEHEPIEGEPTRDADDMALIIYTSGSTGRPKGVMHSFGGISTAAHGIIDVLDLTENERMLSYLPLAHAMERWLAETVSLVAGYQLFFAESLDTFVKDLRRASPTVFLSVPRLWLKFQLGVFQKMPPERLKLLLKIPIVNNIIRKKILSGLGLENVRFAGSGSAPIPGELIQWYKDLGLELLEGYGMSENFSYSHVSMPGKTRVGYVGNTYPEVDCKISEEGEILVKSPANMMGYFKQPELTEECFTKDGYLKTGDRGEIDSEGRLRITGRVKELFKTSKGKYIAPAPIENLINNDPNVELSCVSGSGYPSPYAVVQLSEDLQGKIGDKSVRDRVQSELEALLGKVNSEVEHHERLGFIAVSSKPWTIEDGFLTPTMKIKRAKIEDEYNPLLDDWYEAKKKVVWQE
jgi:long-subunit acyl-CoA synthetase (AMP-forming)